MRNHAASLAFACFAAVAMLAGISQPCLAAAPDPAKAFEEANKLYEQHQFAQSAEAYEHLAAAGVRSPALLFNLGNAHFKSGHTGKAILNYRLAERLAPRDPDLQANLRFVRETVLGPKLTSGPRGWWQRILTLNELAVAAVLASSLCFALLTFRTLKADWKERLGTTAAVSGWMALALGAWLFALARETYAFPAAVVTATETPVRFGPLEESQTAYTLHDGSEVRITGRKDVWVEVEDASGRKGWVKSDSVVRLDS